MYFAGNLQLIVCISLNIVIQNIFKNMFLIYHAFVITQNVSLKSWLKFKFKKKRNLSSNSLKNIFSQYLPIIMAKGKFHE